MPFGELSEEAGVTGWVTSFLLHVQLHQSTQGDSDSKKVIINDN